ncbi:MAG: sigma factor G inhibitor Gin [Sarcina sp.]
MDNNNFEGMDNEVLGCNEIAEILELDRDNVIEIKSEIKTEEEFKSSEVEYVKYNEQEVLNKICIICGKTNSRGIVIMDKKICLECEEKAVKADVKSEFYEDYKDKIFKNVVGKLKDLG